MNINKENTMQLTEDRYRWHDLRKNPNDLPTTEYITIEVFLKSKIYDTAIYDSVYGFRPWYAGYFEEVTPEWLESDCVLGWREVEPLPDM